MAIETIGANTATSDGTIADSGATINTKGAWIQLVASTGIACNELMLYLLKISTPANFLIDIGTGAGGAETVLLSNIHMSQGGAGRGGAMVQIPVNIPSGTRIAVRCQSSVASATATIMGIINNNLSYGSPSWTTYGADTATSRGTQIDPGATSHTKGAWVELTASSVAAKRVVLALGNQANSTESSASYLFDIGTGAGGAEVVVASNLPAKTTAAEDNRVPHLHIVPITITAGTRIAVRSQGSITDATDRLADVVLLLSEVTEPSSGSSGGPVYMMGSAGF